MPPAHILYTAFDLVPSPKGASIHILHFLEGLVNAQYSVDLITPGDGILPPVDTWSGATVFRTAPGKGENFLTRAIAFGEAVQRHVADAPAYDMVHYRSIWGGLQLAQHKQHYQYRTLFEVNGLPSIELKYHYPMLAAAHPRDMGGDGSLLLDKIRQQELATLALSDAIVCPSTVTRAFLVSLGVPEERITVIPNGANERIFSPSPLPPADGRVPQILYIGTLADWQGLNLIIRALPAILAVCPAHLRIVGHGRSRQRKLLLKQIAKLGLTEHISLEDAVSHQDIPAVIAEASVCVAPLGYNDRNVVQGCCPIKVIEYMAAGRPLVAANLPVVRELVREGMDGLLFAPDDAADLARQVVCLLQMRDLAQRLADNAATQARQQFTWHRAQAKLLEVYQQLLGKR